MKHISSFFAQPKRWLGMFGLLSLALGAQAEGSKNLTPGTGARGTAAGSNNYIGYLQHNDLPPENPATNSRYFLKSGAPANERLYIRMKADETVYYGVRRVRTNDAVTNGRLRLQLKYAPTPTSEAVLVNTSYLEPRAPQPTTQELPNLAPGPGVINTPEEAAAGPRYAAGGTSPAAGYDPLSYTNTTGADQDFWIEFEQVDATNVVTTTQSKGWYDCWDFTVRDPATGEKTGRLYSQSWSFTAARAANQLADQFGLFSLIPNPNFGGENFFVKRVSYAGTQPFGVLLVANSQGTTIAGDFREKRKSRDTNIGYAEYKLFVNDPDPSIYPTSVRPEAPTVSTTCGESSTTFTLRVDQAGFGIVFIDGNDNRLYEPAEDRLLEQQTQLGDNAFVWDGNSDAGTKITATTLSVTFSSGVGPINFPLWDCDAVLAKGISVQDVRPGNNGINDYIFWDDSPLLAGFSNPLINPIGDNTEAGSHKWANGDQKLVNSYAVGLLARGNDIKITYDPATACATAPEVTLTVPLPVELSHFTARLQNEVVLVNWETASERDCAYFVVERSTDGKTFSFLGQVAGHGTTSSSHRYVFTDEAPLPGLAYYRLRQIDTDGTAHHGPIVAVKSPTRVAQAMLYPNPATTEVSLRFAEAVQGPVSLRIVDATGRVLWKERRTLAGPTTLLKVPTAQLATAGLYLLQINGSGFGGTYRFTK